MKQKTILSFEVKNELCPFETVKFWKYGCSVRCPSSTRVSWCGKTANKDLEMIAILKRKHSCSECLDCVKLMFGFSNKIMEKIK